MKKYKLTKDFEFPTIIGKGVYKKGLTVSGIPCNDGVVIDVGNKKYFLIPKNHYK